VSLRSSILVTGALLALLGAGCSGAGDVSNAGPEASSPSGVAGAARDWDALRDEALAQEAEALGVHVPADATFVRYISPEEYGAVHARCMTEQGFEATKTFDGGVRYAPIPDDQGEAQRTAAMRCKVMYPVHPRFHVPPTESELLALYQYYVDDLVPCLAREGYEGGEHPSWETFLAAYLSDDDGVDRWHPYSAVGEVSFEVWEKINSTCPQLPPD
jgi:hypothetical protein